MEFFKYTRTFDFMSKSKVATMVSIGLVLFSYILLGVKGLNYGVDFAGGTVVQVKYDHKAPIAQMRKLLKANPLF